MTPDQVVALAVEMLGDPAADVVASCDVELLQEHVEATVWLDPLDSAASLLHRLVRHPVLPAGNRALALLVATHLLASTDLPVTLPPDEVVRAHLEEVARGAVEEVDTAAWLEACVDRSGAVLSGYLTSIRQMPRLPSDEVSDLLVQVAAARVEGASLHARQLGDAARSVCSSTTSTSSRPSP